MKKIMISLLGILIIIFFEFASYKLFEGIDLESFFALWGGFIFILLIGSVFGLFGNSYSGQSIIGGSVKGSPIGNVHITDEMIKAPKKKKVTSGLFKIINLVYFVIIILNAIGYLLSKS